MRGGEVSVERRRRNESEGKADFRGLQLHFNTPPPAPKAIVREKSPFSPTCASAFGAAALVRALLVPTAALGDSHPRARLNRALLVLKLPLRVPSGAAFICASRFPNGGLGISTPRPMGRARELSPKRPLIGVARPLACPFGATALRSATLAIARLSIGRGSPFKVLVKPRFSASPK